MWGNPAVTFALSPHRNSGNGLGRCAREVLPAPSLWRPSRIMLMVDTAGATPGQPTIPTAIIGFHQKLRRRD